MTDENIKEAARLIAEIDRLQAIDINTEDMLVVGRLSRRAELRVGHRDFMRLAEIDAPTTISIIAELVARKKARLNDLRSGC